VVAYAYTEFPVMKDLSKWIKDEVQVDGSTLKVANFNHSKMTFTGLVAIEDPYKNRLKECMNEFKRSGIRM
jgi:magnesium-transporting ATPase (P-type)